MTDQLFESSLPSFQEGELNSFELEISEVPDEALLLDITQLSLPNLVETTKMELEIARGEYSPQRPLLVRPPIPGRYTTRPGDRLSRRELMGAVDEWLTHTNSQSRFIIQGGNRYVSAYAADVYDSKIADIKVMSVEKAPLSAQLLTILTPEERRSLVEMEQLRKVIPFLPNDMIDVASTMTRAELLQVVGNINLEGPFSSSATDENLQTELSDAVACIETGLTIPDCGAITALMHGTLVAETLRRDEPIYFLDDLFYRGRTLYSLAILMTACGGNPVNMRLTTLSSDIKSVDLESPFHEVLRGGVLYPFENSIRTEQGYWQDVGTHYVFTDMGAYWEYLHQAVDLGQSWTRYNEWQSEMAEWSSQNLTESLNELDMSLIGPLLWLSIYHDTFGLELDMDRVVDQKGYRIGACVPFAQLIDRFISQEEPVEARRQFKSQIRDILSAIKVAAAKDLGGYQALERMYRENQHALDYQGLGFMTEQETQHVILSEAPNKTDLVTAEVAQNIAMQAFDSERPLVVGINGVDCSGKTTFSSGLERQLEAHGLPVAVIHMDDFTQPYWLRNTSSDPVERYYNNTFDIETLRKSILAPLTSHQVGAVVLKHQSPHNPSEILEHSYVFSDGPSVVIVEGVFVFRPELADYFDAKIFVDIPLSEMRLRAIERDVPRFGFNVLKKYLTRYIPAQERYLEAVRPGDIADIVIDNSDEYNPFIVKKGGVHV